MVCETKLVISIIRRLGQRSFKGFLTSNILELYFIIQVDNKHLSLGSVLATKIFNFLSWDIFVNVFALFIHLKETQMEDIDILPYYCHNF